MNIVECSIQLTRYSRKELKEKNSWCLNIKPIVKGCKVDLEGKLELWGQQKSRNEIEQTRKTSELWVGRKLKMKRNKLRTYGSGLKEEQL